MRSVISAAGLAVLATGFLPLPATAEWAIPPPSSRFAPLPACIADPVRAERPARPGAAVYRICSDQTALFAGALAEARATGKLLLVTFGATWCSSCAGLQRRIKTPDVLGHAPDSIDYGASFHHLEIGVSATEKGQKVALPSGEAVLQLVLARAPGVKLRAVPFLAVVDPTRPERTFARNLDDLETRDGIDPARFRAVLAEAYAAVRAGAPSSAEPGWLRRKLIRWWNG